MSSMCYWYYCSSFLSSFFFLIIKKNLFIDSIFRFANFLFCFYLALWILYLVRREARLGISKLQSRDSTCLGGGVALFVPFDTIRKTLTMFTLAISTWQSILLLKKQLTISSGDGYISLLHCHKSWPCDLLWQWNACTNLAEALNATNHHISLLCKIGNVLDRGHSINMGPEVMMRVSGALQVNHNSELERKIRTKNQSNKQQQQNLCY